MTSTTVYFPKDPLSDTMLGAAGLHIAEKNQTPKIPPLRKTKSC
jgi:hypothetical protein